MAGVCDWNQYSTDVLSALVSGGLENVAGNEKHLPIVAATIGRCLQNVIYLTASFLHFVTLSS